MTLCWCSSGELQDFLPGYSRCLSCGTLIAETASCPVDVRIGREEEAFYGKEYWFSHQEKDLRLPDIHSRARADLPERCLYWLRTLLKYKPPAAAALELGGAHGGFVAMLRWAGYDASGLELSPWVVEFARQTFGVPMCQGPVEDQNIEQGSLDVIALMDVLEHLQDPVDTMKRCAVLLKPDGLFLIQTPCCRDDGTYDEMAARNDPFLNMLIPEEHLFLFSKKSIVTFFNRLGMDFTVFEPAIFGHYDMFVVAGKKPLRVHTLEEQEKALMATPGGRMVQAILDLDKQRRALEQRCLELEADRSARQEVIERQAREFSEKLAEVESDRVERLDVIRRLNEKLRESESDRAARLEVIERQAREFSEKLAEVEADRAARLEVIERQAREFSEKLAEVEADRAARLEVIERQARDLEALSEQLEGGRKLRAGPNRGT